VINITISNMLFLVMICPPHCYFNIDKTLTSCSSFAFRWKKDSVSRPCLLHLNSYYSWAVNLNSFKQRNEILRSCNTLNCRLTWLPFGSSLPRVKYPSMNFLEISKIHDMFFLQNKYRTFAGNLLSRSLSSPSLPKHHLDPWISVHGHDLG
jgi:hypothetical protein